MKKKSKMILNSVSHSNRAFTLLEIVLAITLIGILSGILASRTDFSGTWVHSDSSLLQIHLVQMKQNALASRQRVGLIFHPSNRTYEGNAIPVDNNQTALFREAPLNVTMKVNEIITDLTGNAIYFDGHGQPVDENGNFHQTPSHITLRSGNQEERITIEPLTGYIHN